MTTRRYGEEEVREIFSLASTTDLSHPSPLVESDGLTVEELANIGREVGLDPVRITHAAAALDARGRPSPVQRVFGLPVGVSRTVDLPRAPTDREWEQLVSQFRTAFGVLGQATTAGGLRTWSHGNLQLSVEPTAHGHQLRLATRNEAAVALTGLGVVFGGMAVLTSAVAVAAGKPEKALAILGLFGGIAMAAAITNLVCAPRWARERDRQMTTVAANAVLLLATPASPSDA